MLRASGSRDALELHLLWQLTLGALLGALILATVHLADVGPGRLCQTLAPLAGFGLAALLLKTPANEIDVGVWFGAVVALTTYLMIAAGLAVSEDLARRMAAHMRGRARAHD